MATTSSGRRSTIVCRDEYSGERFRILPGDDEELLAAIEDYIRLGIDKDTGSVDYSVACSDGRHFRGTVDPR